MKVLKRCKDAISSASGTGGKLVIIEAVVGLGGETAYKETQLFYDMLMLAVHASAERDEHEWKSLFNRSGFSSYKIVHTFGFMSIIEVYP
jgi:O-methyltransferase domain